jgi:hypothetical protein
MKKEIGYSAAIESAMRLHFSHLCEKDRRHYAYIESVKLGHGGQKHISALFDLSPHTLRKAGRELNNTELFAEIPVGKQRRPRKKKKVECPLTVALTAFINRHKAGSPTNPDVYWIHLKPADIARKFLSEHPNFVKLSNGFVKKLLKTLGFRFRKMTKNLATGSTAVRNAQFEIIFSLVTAATLSTAIISIDCKKKEVLGNLYRPGKVWATAPLEAYDHDYSTLAGAKVVPHGIYDLQHNEGYMTIGTNHETAEFIMDNLLWWWDNYGIHRYPDTKTIMILCDAGGANSYRHHAFKKLIQKLAREIGKDILICHYPPYSSKWNPIEHRLFAHVHRAMQGTAFENYNQVQTLIDNTSTKTGLKVFTRINETVYPIGLKTTKDEVDFTRISFNKTVPHLSYIVAA